MMHGSMRMSSAGPAGPAGPMSSSAGCPAAFRSSGMSSGFAPPVDTLAPMASQRSAGENELGVYCTVVVSKLLDVPVENSMFGKEAKTYQLRVLDHKRKELARSEEIQGLEDHQLKGLTAQTFAIPDDLGTLHAKTLSKTIQVQAGHALFVGALGMGWVTRWFKLGFNAMLSKYFNTHYNI